jgi:hypothetical protein
MERKSGDEHASQSLKTHKRIKAGALPDCRNLLDGSEFGARQAANRRVEKVCRDA